MRRARRSARQSRAILKTNRPRPRSQGACVVGHPEKPRLSAHSRDHPAEGSLVRILVLNPNTTASVTDLVVASGKAVASPGTELVAATAPRGLPYIVTRAEAAISGAIALEMLAGAKPEPDAAIIAAFGDPGLLAARELFDFPVVGLAEAGMLAACMLGRRFAIVSFAAAMKPWYLDCVE